MIDSSVRPQETVAPIDIHDWMSQHIVGSFDGQLPQSNEAPSIPRPATPALSSISPTHKTYQKLDHASDNSLLHNQNDQESSLSPPIDVLAKDLHVSPVAPSFNCSYATVDGQDSAPLEVDPDLEAGYTNEELENYALKAIRDRRQAGKNRIRQHRLPSRSSSARSDKGHAFSKPTSPEDAVSDRMSCDEGYSALSDTENPDIAEATAQRVSCLSRITKGTPRVRFRRAFEVAQQCSNAVPKATRMRKRKSQPRALPTAGNKGAALSEVVRQTI